jgi:hypothetical protein
MTPLSATKQKLLDEWLTGAYPVAGRELSTIPARGCGSFAPASPAQEQIWIRSTQDPENSASYIETISIHGNRPVDAAVMERAFAEIVRRHEAWRTSFELINGRPVQFVHASPSAIAIPVFDLTDDSPAARNERLRDLLSAEVQKPMDLKAGPLVRPALLFLDEQKFILLVAVHQIVVDGVSAYQVFSPARLLLSANCPSNSGISALGSSTGIMVPRETGKLNIGSRNSNRCAWGTTGRTAAKSATDKRSSDRFFRLQFRVTFLTRFSTSHEPKGRQCSWCCSLSSRCWCAESAGSMMC